MCSSAHGVWSVVGNIRGKNDCHSADSIVSLFSDPVIAAESISSIFRKTFVNSDSFARLPVEKPASNICKSSDEHNMLLKLKTNKSGGSDGIIPLLLKKCADVKKRV